MCKAIGKNSDLEDDPPALAVSVRQYRYSPQMILNHPYGLTPFLCRLPSIKTQGGPDSHVAQIPRSTLWVVPAARLFALIMACVYCVRDHAAALRVIRPAP